MINKYKIETDQGTSATLTIHPKVAKRLGFTTEKSNPDSIW